MTVSVFESNKGDPKKMMKKVKKVSESFNIEKIVIKK